jgi:hypothetical protein
MATLVDTVSEKNKEYAHENIIKVLIYDYGDGLA